MIPDYDLNDDFARGLRSALEEFNSPSASTSRPRVHPVSRTPGVTVVLAVRKGRLSPDEMFEHKARTISRLQARIEAEQAARAQGYTVGHVVDYRMGE